VKITLDHLQQSLCAAFCGSVTVSAYTLGACAVTLPFIGRDGDHLTVYVSSDAGGWKISDKGATLMRLSYENDLDQLLTGARERIFIMALEENGLAEDDGELFTRVPANNLLQGIFALGQGVTRVESLGLWTKSRVENTFMADLKSLLVQSAGADKLQENYTIAGLINAANYPIDFYIQTPHWPLYVFGVANKDKAQLTTIILQHLTAHRLKYNSMVVYSDIDSIPKSDQKRLMVAANDAVPNITDYEAIK